MAQQRKTKSMSDWTEVERERDRLRERLAKRDSNKRDVMTFAMRQSPRRELVFILFHYKWNWHSSLPLTAVYSLLLSTISHISYAFNALEKLFRRSHIRIFFSVGRPKLQTIFFSLAFLLCRFFCILIRLHLDLFNIFFFFFSSHSFTGAFILSLRFSWPDSMHALRRLTRSSDGFYILVSFGLAFHPEGDCMCMRVSGFVCVSDEPVDFKVKVVAWKISLWYE